MTCWLDSLQPRIEKVRAQIHAACARVGRAPESVVLVAVSKYQSVDAIREAYGAGLRVFGENYVQELNEKRLALRDCADIEFHLIGHLQRNKVKQLFSESVRPIAIQSIDGERLVEQIATCARTVKQIVPVWLQIDIAGESQKSGCSLDEVGALVRAVRTCAELVLEGFMIIPPATDDPEQTRPYFRKLRELAREHDVAKLSMGMSSDFEVAIEEGATHVRVGTAIFGARPIP